MQNLKQGNIIALSHKERLFHILIFASFVYLWWGVYSGRHINGMFEWMQLGLYASVYFVFLSFNIHVLIPRYLFRGKYITYFLLSLLVNIVSYCLEQLSYSNGIGDVADRFSKETLVYLKDFGINILVNAMIGAVGLAFVLLHSLFKTQKQISEYENLILKAELESLKNQISPHFLFNTLNNLYVLCKKDSGKAAESILALADITRYQLYEIQKETVRLEQEVRYINDLLNLEKLRKDDLIITMAINIGDNNCMIQPMMFTPLVENAIKHGSQQLTQCTIVVTLNVNKTELHFSICNSMSASGKYNEKGLGLHNLSRRLQISYPHKHSLNHTVKNDMYCADLRLELV